MVRLAPAAAVLLGLNPAPNQSRRLISAETVRGHHTLALAGEINNEKKRDDEENTDAVFGGAGSVPRKSRLFEKMRATRPKGAGKRGLLAGARSVAAGHQIDTGVGAMEECVPENDADADVGTLSFSFPRDHYSPCQAGYVCVPSGHSPTGGHCVPDSTYGASRNLKISGRDSKIGPGYCPTGCPASVCECYESNMSPQADCYDALTDACRDGTYLTSCASSDPDEYAYAAGACDTYVCLDDRGLTIGDGPLCDFSTVDCADCYCSYYSAICDLFGPLCAAGSDASFCGYLDVVCSTAYCCETDGAAACIMDDFLDTDEPTQRLVNSTDVEAGSVTSITPESSEGPTATPSLEPTEG
mmetsp:Transcript_27526/g.55535  ORF Transcript_27526/g.55535 Transcript_27526/m.55535 type:complete len:357 (+) Transcript_27526:192-1262(+)